MQTICPYCDFTRVKAPEHVLKGDDNDPRIQRMHEAYRRTLDRFLARLHDGNLRAPHLPRYISSIFFGGGTPSLASPSLLSDIVSRCREFNDGLRRRVVSSPPDTITDRDGLLSAMQNEKLEVSMEANPTSVERSRLLDYKQAGVNRVSIGVQSLDNDDLQFLGRTHTSYDALKTVELACELFSPQRVSLDLMYALPSHAKDPTSWQRVLERALDQIGTHHISLYQLTIERNTKFYAPWKRGEFSLPGEDTCADLYDMTVEMTRQRGLARYEVSNFARPGSECKHNVHYWQYRDYYGIGCGAHSRLMDTVDGDKHAYMQYKDVDRWASDILEHGGDGHQKAEIISREDRIHELFLMGLRLVEEGIPESRLLFHSGKSLEDVVNANILRLLQTQQLIEIVNPASRTLRATQKGVNVLDALLETLLT